ncbi:MAG TPA: diphthine synthase [Ignisphaera aggregans]|uniref:Diphthine synthase n=1 Tax=Ignisphaera aggregans TaxID=334771 RepID=A0A833DUD0_9CREN|nr:diphthine synthase [Ignisphaera aggregans]
MKELRNISPRRVCLADSMLKLIGLGLSADLITLRSLLELMKCKRILIDSYTSMWFPSLDSLIDILRKLSKHCVKVYRESLEGKAINEIIAMSREEDVCIAVAGDPLIATTHSSLIVEAFKQGVEVEVIPSTSILSIAISLSCLQAYRFGKCVTLVKPRNGIVFEYPIYVIEENRNRNLHTILLLDLDVAQGYYMTPKEAANLLVKLQERLGKRVLDYDDYLIILGAIGSEYGSIQVLKLYELIEGEERYNTPPYTLIIPAKKLHPMEEECIEMLRLRKLYFRPRISMTDIYKVIRVLSSDYE